MTGTLIPVTRDRRWALIPIAKLPQTRSRLQECLNDDLLAELGISQIHAMTQEEVIRVICAGRLSYITPDRVKHLRLYDRPCLDRLASRACQACRHRRDAVQAPAADPFVSISRSWGARR